MCCPTFDDKNKETKVGENILGKILDNGLEKEEDLPDK